MADKLTHLMYAFANVTTTPSPACAIADSWADYQTPYLPSVSGAPYTGPMYGNFAAIQQLKQLHPSLKVLMSIGGASAANTAAFSAAAGTAAGRQALASSCISMFVQGNIAPGITAPGLFDGFNIDWEFPAASDTQNFTALLKEFRRQLDALGKTTGKQYVMSFDGPAGAQNYVNIDLKHAAEQVDFITVDGYNYAGSWDTQTNHASPLFDDKQDPLNGQGLDIDATVNAYLKAGVPAKKYTMGLPLYGAGWTGVPNVNHGLYQNSTGPSPVLLANGQAECTDLSGATPGCDLLLTPGIATYATLANLTANGYTPLLRSAENCCLPLRPGIRNFLHLRRSGDGAAEDGLYRHQGSRRPGRRICVGPQRRRRQWNHGENDGESPGSFPEVIRARSPAAGRRRGFPIRLRPNAFIPPDFDAFYLLGRTLMMGVAPLP